MMRKIKKIGAMVALAATLLTTRAYASSVELVTAAADNSKPGAVLLDQVDSTLYDYSMRGMTMGYTEFSKLGTISKFELETDRFYVLQHSREDFETDADNIFVDSSILGGGCIVDICENKDQFGRDITTSCSETKNDPLKLACQFYNDDKLMGYFNYIPRTETVTSLNFLDAKVK